MSLFFLHGKSKVRFMVQFLGYDIDKKKKGGTEQ